MGGLGGRTDAAVIDDLVSHWSQPHRRYHTAAHLEAVLREAASLGDELRLDDDSRAVVTLAACAHDVVYDARPGDDERASAEWARDALSRCDVEPGAVQRVVDLVLATITHTAEPADAAASVLLDADLAILAAEPAEYDAYAAAVRAEYPHVADDEWRAGRARVLGALLDRKALFSTEPGRARWEAQARANVAAELNRLDHDD